MINQQISDILIAKIIFLKSAKMKFENPINEFSILNFFNEIL